MTDSVGSAGRKCPESSYFQYLFRPFSGDIARGTSLGNDCLPSGVKIVQEAQGCNEQWIHNKEWLFHLFTESRVEIRSNRRLECPYFLIVVSQGFDDLLLRLVDYFLIVIDGFRQAIQVIR